MRTGLLSYNGYRYARWALLLSVLTIALYVSQYFDAPQPANGGTWQGYVLGSVGALLIVWLSCLGVRKRSYRSTTGTVQGWTSAHVWLGMALIIVATLHCAAQFGWNVHTLAYVLMCLVIVSGLYGLYVYTHMPSTLAENSAGQDRDAWLGELGELDEQIGDTARGCNAEVQAMALSAVENTRLGGGLWAQLSARDGSRIKLPNAASPVRNRDQSTIIKALSERIPVAEKQGEAAAMNELLGLFGRRAVILSRLRRHIQSRGLLKAWLYLHVPMTLALLAALIVHIITVFLYW